jgi:eukaryotic-like serine/threonine-protein kinase
VSVLCPYCKYEVKLKGAKAGRFTPKCPKCARAFVLTVPEQPDQPMSAAPLRTAPTGPPESPPPSAPAKPALSAPPNLDQTMAEAASGPAKPVPPKVPPVKKPAPARPAQPRLDQTMGEEESAPATPGTLEDTMPPPEPSPPPKPAVKPARPTMAPVKKPAAAQPASAARPAPKPAPRQVNLERTAPESVPIGATGEWQPPPDGGNASPDGTAVFEDSSAGETGQAKPKSAGKNQKATASNAIDATTAGEGDNTDFEADSPDDMPDMLGGYKVVRQLGQGGMGTVYLAQQLSLDRSVALKVMNPQWASNANFLARFTREAYAAAQLVHHHIIQIYDIGAEADTAFFSMEFVKGKNLGELLQEKGPMDVEMAVGYILQAARGLKFAHDQGMVHRDIKPDNLMLNDQGLVKVADLGLVKTPGAIAAEDQIGVGDAAPSGQPASGKAAPVGRPGSKLSEVSNVTAIGVAMGTPAFMAPEQGRNAALVDQRADIYSLGCTLYVLLTGRPPFEGKTAIEVITKHSTAPIIRPEVFVKRVPKDLSDVLVKMMAKKPEDRQQDMSEVITDLENFLGIQRTGPFTPREEHANLLEEGVKQFNEASAARLRRLVILGFFGVCAVGVLGSALVGLSWLAGGFLGLALMTTLFTFLVNGVTFKTQLFIKSRELIFSSGWSDWLTWSVGVVLTLLVLYLVGLFWAWLAFLVVAVLLAVGFHVLIERKLLAQRKPALEKVEGLLRTMRLGGLEEDAIRLFVCKYAGDHWEPMYEALFGYEFMLQARQHWAQAGTGKRRPRHNTWRDPLIHWIEARQKALKETREKKHLLKVEQMQLEAKGLKVAEARAQAEQVAHTLMSQATKIKLQAEEGKAEAAAQPGKERPKTAPKPAAKPNNVSNMLRFAGNAANNPAPPRPAGPGLIKTVRRLVFGVRTRFLMGAALLGLGLWWLHDNPLLYQQVVDLLTRFTLPKPTWADSVPLSLTNLLPGNAGALLFNSINPAVAGVLLIFSTFFGSRKAIVACYLGGLIVFLGQLCLSIAGMTAIDVPMWGSVPASVLSLAGGSALAVLGMVVAMFFEKGN